MPNGSSPPWHVSASAPAPRNRSTSYAARWALTQWSRGATEPPPLVYVVSDDRIDFIQARYHYER
ncbi:MAG: type II toxin-antitoxin system YoeB family toxin [Chloroflexi bacterium]|nr:type II toxin-antitoxin system YoeB family toxin [Chloroflexota bacterium]